MAIPLYLGNGNQKFSIQDNGNVGLYFERFFNQFSQDFNTVGGVVKLNWLNTFSQQKIGDDNALQENAKQQMILVSALKGEFKFFNTQWHFVTGMGYPHPVENGLNWHPVYGVPYITGAAVKGLVRAWVEQWAYDEGEDQQKRARLLKWFGSDHKDSEKQTEVRTGDLIFFDALPTQQVKMKVDIMTPHQGKWYREGNAIQDSAREPEKLPADWHEPDPIPFLVVDKNVSFLFSVAPRNSLVAQNFTKEEMLEVTECLTNALEWLGAGAKTSGGYGQMLFDKDTSNYQKKENERIQVEQIRLTELAEKTKNVSELAKKYFKESSDNNWDENKDDFGRKIEFWLDQLEAQFDTDVVNNLKDLVDKHFTKGKKKLLTNPKSFKPRQQNIADRLNKLLDRT